MMTKEEYKHELIRMWDSVRENGKGRDNCNGVSCQYCQLHGFKYGCANSLSAFEIYCAVEKWSKEHPLKKYKISRMEYDILELFICSGLDTYHFDQDDLLISLFRKGYFKGANEKMTIAYYFYNCEVDA